MENKIEHISPQTIKIHAFSWGYTIRIIFILLICISFLIFIALNLAKFTWITGLQMMTFFGIFYYIFFRNVFVNVDKLIETGSDYILIGKKRIERYKLAYISTNISSSGINGIIMTYEVCINYKNDVINKTRLIIINEKSQALKIADELGVFLNLKTYDETKR